LKPVSNLNKHPNEVLLESHSDFNTYGKMVEVVFADGERGYYEPKPLPKEESERDKRIRAEVFGEFRQYGRMPILWNDIEKR
jgi:hypothetical protein